MIRFGRVQNGVSDDLATVARSARDFRPAWPLVTRLVAAEERALFGSARAGRLRQTTMERKRRAAQRLVPLVASGAAQRALTSPGGPGQVVRAKPHSYTFTFEPGRLFYLRFVARRFRLIDVRRSGQRQIARVLEDHLLKGVTR